jgi:hypothetical protein
VTKRSRKNINKQPSAESRNLLHSSIDISPISSVLAMSAKSIEQIVSEDLVIFVTGANLQSMLDDFKTVPEDVLVEFIFYCIGCAMTQRSTMKDKAEVSLRANANLARVITDRFMINSLIKFSELAVIGYMLIQIGIGNNAPSIQAWVSKVKSNKFHNYDLSAFSAKRMGIIMQIRNKFPAKDFDDAVETLRLYLANTKSFGKSKPAATPIAKTQT